MSWSSQKILFVTGKGGVGKSAVAAGLALKQAQAGKKVLLVELGNISYFQNFLNINSPVEYQPKEILPNLSLALWNGRECLKEYLISLIKIEQLYNLFFENRVTRSLINIAPGLSEIAILGKATSGLRHITSPMNFDQIIIDTYSTGHALSLFRTPGALIEAVKVGPMADQSKQINYLLADEDVCGYIVVSIPEELPTTESIELYQTLTNELKFKPQLVMNKVLFPPLEKADLLTLQNTSDFTKYLCGKINQQELMIQRLKEISSDVTILPLIFESDSKEILYKLAEAWE